MTAKMKTWLNVIEEAIVSVINWSRNEKASFPPSKTELISKQAPLSMSRYLNRRHFYLAIKDFKVLFQAYPCHDVLNVIKFLTITLHSKKFLGIHCQSLLPKVQKVFQKFKLFPIFQKTLAYTNEPDSKLDFIVEFSWPFIMQM